MDRHLCCLDVSASLRVATLDRRPAPAPARTWDIGKRTPSVKLGRPKFYISECPSSWALKDLKKRNFYEPPPNCYGACSSPSNWMPKDRNLMKRIESSFMSLNQQLSKTFHVEAHPWPFALYYIPDRGPSHRARWSDLLHCANRALQARASNMRKIQIFPLSHSGQTYYKKLFTL